MTKKEIANTIGLKYTERSIAKASKEWLEKALELYQKENDKDKARRFIQQYIATR